ncbi:MAG: TonB-dependent receptor [Chloracidobacterium sp.]|nr:TonB-dependent receptor [Chloracidobacterium sp.]
MSSFTRSNQLLLICAVLLSGISEQLVNAQIDRGRVTGTVKDPSGAVVAGAQLTLTNEATGVAQNVSSTSGGSYILEAVPVGSYILRVEAKGFKTYQATGIQVHVQNVVTADVSLEIGEVSSVVSVTSSAALLQAQDASLGQTISTASVNDLPLNGRNWISLANIAAGSYLLGGPGSASIFSNGVEPGQVDYRVNGVNNNLEAFGGFSVAPIPDAIQEFKLQTGDNSAEFGHSVGAVINAVVKSGTNQFHGDLFEFLRNEALNANDFFSNLNGVKRQEYRQNQFGGTIGGPVLIPKLYNGRNRTFFFFDYQRTNRLVPATFTDSVPTASMQSSGFTNLQDLIASNNGTRTDALGRKFPLGAVFDPTTTRTLAPGTIDPISGIANNQKSAITVRDPFYTGSLMGMTDFTNSIALLNRIPAARIDPNAVRLLQLLPAPTKGGLINNFFTGVPQTTNMNQYDLRIDEYLGSKDSLFGVFSRQTANQTAAQPFSAQLGSALQTAFITTQPVYVLTLSETHTFSPTLGNEARIGLNHNYNTRELPMENTLGIPQQYGIPGIQQIPGNGGIPTFNISGFSAFGGRRFAPTIQTTEAQDFTDNLTWIHGGHELKTGIQFNRTVGDILQPAYAKGNLTYSGIYSDIPNQNSGLVGIADFLLLPQPSSIAASPGVTTYNNLGGLSGYNGSNYAGTNYTAPYWGAYANDNWKITPRLTLNLGLRWDHFSPYSEDGGREANLAVTNGNGFSGTYYITQKGCNVPRAAAFDSLLAGYNINIDCVPGLAVNQTQKTNFAPRVGAAYRLRSDLVVRAGYGISYGAFDSVGYGGTLGTNYPFQYTINSPNTTSQAPITLANGQTATMENIFAAVNLEDPTLLNPIGLGLSGKQYHYLTPYVQSMNLMAQYQFTSHDSIQAGYVASLGRHLDTLGYTNSPNMILPVGVNPNNYRPFPNLAGNSEFLSTGAVSNYRSLQANYEHRFQNGLSALVNYTWGKCMADVNGKSGLGPGYRAEWLPNFGIQGDYTLCSADATHVLHATGQSLLPFGKGQPLLHNTNRLVNAFIGGWQFNYIFVWQSGQPFTVGCPIGTSSDFGCNALMAPGQDPYAGPHDRTQWLNPNAFVQPPRATEIGDKNYAVLGGSANQLRGPRLINLDASLFKQFTVREKTQLQFRVEAFNLTNTADFGNPGQLNFSNLKNFSNITGTRNNQRLVQLALKLYW